MLPKTGDVGESEVDHLDLVVLDDFEEIFGVLALVMHLNPPPFLRSLASAVGSEVIQSG
jgi:hypothetical protein